MSIPDEWGRGLGSALKVGIVDSHIGFGFACWLPVASDLQGLLLRVEFVISRNGIRQEVTVLIRHILLPASFSIRPFSLMVYSGMLSTYLSWMRMSLLPRIFEQHFPSSFRSALIQTLHTAQRADFCVGYFNLRGWRLLQPHMDHWQGDTSARCRLLIGMHRSPQEDIRALFSLRCTVPE